VSTVDWVVVAFTAALAVYGYLQGFIVGVLSLAGFALGAVLGARLGPLLLPGGSRSQYAPLFGLFGALLVGGVLASGLEGLGVRARRTLKIPGLRTADGLLGAALTACIGLGIAWIVGAVALQATSSRTLRLDIQRSAILAELNHLLPPSGPILDALARFDPLPPIHGPAATVPAPTRGILAAAGVRAAFQSVVRVTGTACGLGIEGSGWVVAPGLVITNAHVVAGESDTTVQAGGVGASMPATPVVFDAHDDVAILRVRGLELRSLALARMPATGTAAAILGYPLDGPFNAQPGRIGRTQLVRTQDAYGMGNFVREITPLRGLVRPGNSGGPMVDARGQVVATVFAAVTGTTTKGGFAVPSAIVAHQLTVAERSQSAVRTGPCAG
jgi:S1-C subfamily serine protease